MADLQKLYLNTNNYIVSNIDDLRYMYDCCIHQGQFDEWKSKYVIDVDNLPNIYTLESLTKSPIRDITGYYKVKKIIDDNIYFPHILQIVLEKIAKYNTIFSEICTDDYVNFPSAIAIIKIIRGHTIPEIGYLGHNFKKWDGIIIKACIS